MVETVTSEDGTSIAYERTGRGPPLVLVHGTTADHTRWEPVLPGFEAAFTVYAMDRRGRGASGDASAYAIEREVEDIVALVEAIDEPVVLLGHSYGALCALEAALVIEDLRALVLYEPAMEVGGDRFYDDEVIAEMEWLSERGDLEETLVTFFREIAEFSDDELEALRTAPNWSDRVAAAHTAVRETITEQDYSFDPDRFSSLDTPTLLLAGSESAVFLRDATEAVNETLPNARLVVFEGHGHVAQNTATARFVEEVVGFVRQLDREVGPV